MLQFGTLFAYILSTRGFWPGGGLGNVLTHVEADLRWIDRASHHYRFKSHCCGPRVRVYSTAAKHRHSADGQRSVRDWRFILRSKRLHILQRVRIAWHGDLRSLLAQLYG